MYEPLLQVDKGKALLLPGEAASSELLDAIEALPPSLPPSQASVAPLPATAPGEVPAGAPSNVPASVALKVENWQRVRGDKFAVRVPPGFEDIMPEPVVNDVSQFGSIQEAASVLVPAGAKLLATREYTATPRRVERTYYLYEFVAQGVHVAMSCVAAKGKIYVLGATAPEGSWRAAAGRLRAAAGAFSLVI
eukprot:jgi/Mesen1/6581/ME000336S05805